MIRILLGCPDRTFHKSHKVLLITQAFKTLDTYDDICLDTSDKALMLRNLSFVVSLQIDLRFANDAEGKCAIVVAPVMRFADIGFNSDVRIDQLGNPDKMISGFGPELFGSPLQDGDILNTEIVEKDGVKFYNW